MEKTVKTLILKLLHIVINAKNLLFFHGTCRYHPTCSQYAHDALRIHKLSTALVLIIKRIARCNPLFSYGFDPVPERTEHRKVY